jgi:tetratricopeptide (TPR) repeat protein
VATGRLIDEDPQEALGHALAARRLASRIAAVREAVGLAAYRAGEWQTAIGELRTYHRMSGRQTHLAVLADCERALGRPERAIDLFRGADRDALAPAEAVELLIVAAGARADLGQKDAAVSMLQVRELAAPADEPWAPRLRYAYADALLAVDRRDEAREWFARAADADEDAETDAAERLLELDGVLIEGDEEADEEADAQADDQADDQPDETAEAIDDDADGTGDETGKEIVDEADEETDEVDPDDDVADELAAEIADEYGPDADDDDKDLTELEPELDEEPPAADATAVAGDSAGEEADEKPRDPA